MNATELDIMIETRLNEYGIAFMVCNDEKAECKILDPKEVTIILRSHVPKEYHRRSLESFLLNMKWKSIVKKD